MSAPTLPGTGPLPAGTRTAAGTAGTAATPGTVATGGEKFPRPHADPQDDWPLDVHLPDDKEDDEC